MTLRISDEQASIICHALMDYAIKKCSEASDCFARAVVEDRVNNFIESELYHAMGNDLEEIARETDQLYELIERGIKR